VKFIVDPVQQENELADTTRACCLGRSDQLWAADDIVLAGADQREIATDAVDRLPPWRAVPYVRVALAAGGRFEAGTMEQMEAVAVQVGPHAEPGWWRHALGLPARTPLAAHVQPRLDGYEPSPGWKVVRTA
jgi:hypothetical protein